MLIVTLLWIIFLDHIIPSLTESLFYQPHIYQGHYHKIE